MPEPLNGEFPNGGERRLLMADDSVLEFHQKEIAAIGLELGAAVIAAYRAGLRVRFTLSEEQAPDRSYPSPLLEIVVDRRTDA